MTLPGDQMNRLAFLVLAVFCASFAKAQTFENQAGESVRAMSVAARRAGEDMARRNKNDDLPAPQANVIVGGPKDKSRGEEPKLFDNGWKEAMKALKGKSCQKFFADHGDD